MIKKNYKKILYCIVAVLCLVLVFRVIQAKFDFSNQQEEILETATLINVDNYQQESAFVYATGKIESLEQIDIKSEMSAKIKRINFSIGDSVRREQTILELDNSVLAAQLAQAQANLDQKKAGASEEDVNIYRTAVKLAEADLENTKISMEKSITAYEASVELAKNNLSMGSTTLLNALNSVDTVLISSLNVSDNILGIDNGLANDSFEDYLGVLNISKLGEAEMSYSQAKQSEENYSASLDTLNEESTNFELSLVVSEAKSALYKAKENLLDVQELLNVTPPVGTLSQITLDGLKTSVISAISSVDTTVSSLATANQGEDKQGSGLNSYNIAYKKALQDLEDAKATAQSTIKIKEAAYEQALANLQKAEADPRDVDLAYLEAVVSQAAAAYSKSVITAPFDGIISSMPFSVGDLVSAGQVVAGVVNREGLQMKAYINQDERSLISEGSKVIIEDKYEGIVSKIAPSIDDTSKKIEVLIVLLDNSVELTVGQYANVKISLADSSDSQTYILPLSAIKIYSSKKTVFFLDGDNIIQEKEIQVGDILGDTIEVMAGLSAEDNILSSVNLFSLGQKVNVK